MKHWILVASRDSARILETPGLQVPLADVEVLENEEGRLQEQELNTDRLGKNRDEGPGAHGYGVRDTAVRRSTMDFVRGVCEHVDKARARGAFEHLSVIATPELLGMLRKCWSPATGKHIIEEVAKDLSDAPESQIRGSLSRLNA